jgi:hypothetical protein
VLTDAEKQRVKYHLGYMNTSTAAGLAYGMSVPIQTLFLVDNAMTKLPEGAVGIVRDLLAKLDFTEAQLFESQERLAAEKLGDITMRADEADALSAAYKRWADRLADTLGVPLYYWSTKFQGISGAGMVRVRRS